MPTGVSQISISRRAKLLGDLLLILLTFGSLVGSLASMPTFPARVFLVARDGGRLDLLEGTTFGDVPIEGLNCTRENCGGLKINTEESPYNLGDPNKITLGKDAKTFLKNLQADMALHVYRCSESVMQSVLEDDKVNCIRSHSNFIR